MYNNPFIYTNQNLLKPGILGMLKNINWGTFLGNAGKTLGVINQAIPIVYQIKPIISNARTIFKIANGLKESSSPKQQYISKNNYNSANNNIKNETSSYSPIFYL